MLNLTAKETNKTTREGSADFLLKIMYKKNYSWQGEIHWLATDKKRTFRSSLELFMLLQEAMEETGIPQAEYDLRTWKQKEIDNLPAYEDESVLASGKRKFPP